jgi:methylated-DNA-protein-cysteine methyltransferase-like protein
MEDVMTAQSPRQFSTPPGRQQFNLRVWELVQQIPAGCVASYGQIARFIPPPEGMSERDYMAWGARWVGGAMAACPSNVPWQRVLNAQGAISLRPNDGGELQRKLLLSEGVYFDERGHVNLKQFAWSGPDPEWLAEHGFRRPSGD